MKTYLQKIGMTLALVLVSVVGWGQSYASGYPRALATSATSAQISVKFSSIGYTTAFVVVPASDDTPSANQIIDLLNANDQEVNPNQCGTFIINNASLTYRKATTELTPNTNYKACFTTYNSGSFIPINNEPTVINFQTLNDPIAYNSSYPNVGNVADISAIAYSSLNQDNSSTRFVVLSTIEASPSLDQVWAGQDALGTNVSTSRKGTITIDIANSINSAFFDNLSENTSYNVYFASKDQAGNFLEPTTPTVVSFTTIDLTSPTMVFDPLNGEISIPISKVITITYNEAIRNIDDSPIDNFNVSSLVVLKVDGNPVPCTKTINGNIISLTPNSPLAEGKEYQLTVYAVEDLSNNATQLTTIIFETNDTTAPIWQSTSPGSSSTDNSIFTNVVLTYNEGIRNISDGEINNLNLASLISVSPTTPFTATIDALKKIVTITFKEGLQSATAYTVTVSPVEDKYNNETVAMNLIFTTEECNVWNGSVDSDWSKAANWNGTYTSGNSIIVENGTNDPILNSNYSCSNFLIKAGAGIEIPSGITLQLKSLKSLSSNDILIGNGSILINGALTTVNNNNTFYQNASSVAYTYHISSPVVGASRNSIGSTGVIAEKQTSPYAWVTLNNDVPLTDAKGYASRDYANTWKFSGVIHNNSEYTFPGVRTPVNFGWNLAGNPYPCSIDWNQVVKTDVNSTIYIWRNEQHTYGTYNSSIPDNQGYVNLNSNNPNLIPSMHAFFIQIPIDKTNGSISIPKAARTLNKFTYMKSASTSGIPVIRLSGKINNYEDETALFYVEGATLSGNDIYDSEKYLADSETEGINLFTISSENNLVLNSVGNEDINSTTQIGFRANYSDTKEYTLQLKSLSNIPDNVDVYLEDTYLTEDCIKDLRITPSYKFSSPKATNVDRFKLHVVEKSATPTNQTINENGTINPFIVYSKGKIVYIQIFNVSDSKCQILDINGRVIKDEILNKDVLNAININNGEGVYFVKITSPNNVLTTKILISK